MNRPYVHRGNRMPGVYQRCQKDCPVTACKRGHGWSFIVELAEPNGDRRQVAKGGFSSGKEAADARAEVVRKHREGTLPKNDKLTVTQWLRDWLVTQEELVGLRDGTIVDYRRHIESYWIPSVGNHKLADLRPRHVTDTLRALMQGRQAQIEAAVELNARYARLAADADEERIRAGRKRPVKPKRVPVPRPFGPATAQRVRATLRAALNAAVRAEELQRNVAALATVPKVRRRRVKPWSPALLGGWLDAIEGERLYPLFHLGVFAGLRRGELCGLGWDEVDLDAARIVVGWQITGISYRKGRKAEKEGHKLKYRVRLKTSEGEDLPVDLDTETVSVLRKWRRDQAKERLALGRAYRNDENLVFTRADGSPFDPTQVYRVFKCLIKRHDMPDVPLHNLRHVSASLQIEAGVDIAVVSKRLRHSKIGLTSDTYGHLVGSVGKTAAESAAAVVPRRRAG